MIRARKPGNSLSLCRQKRAEDLSGCVKPQPFYFYLLPQTGGADPYFSSINLYLPGPKSPSSYLPILMRVKFVTSIPALAQIRLTK